MACWHHCIAPRTLLQPDVTSRMYWKWRFCPTVCDGESMAAETHTVCGCVFLRRSIPNGPPSVMIYVRVFYWQIACTTTPLIEYIRGDCCPFSSRCISFNTQMTVARYYYMTYLASWLMGYYEVLSCTHCGHL